MATIADMTSPVPGATSTMDPTNPTTGGPEGYYTSSAPPEVQIQNSKCATFCLFVISDSRPTRCIEMLYRDGYVNQRKTLQLFLHFHSTVQRHKDGIEP